MLQQGEVRLRLRILHFLDEGLARNFVRLIGEGLKELRLMEEHAPLMSVEVGSVDYEGLYKDAKGFRSFKLDFRSLLTLD